MLNWKNAFYCVQRAVFSCLDGLTRACSRLSPGLCHDLYLNVKLKMLVSQVFCSLRRGMLVGRVDGPRQLLHVQLSKFGERARMGRYKVQNKVANSTPLALSRAMLQSSRSRDSYGMHASATTRPFRALLHTPSLAFAFRTTLRLLR